MKPRKITDSKQYKEPNSWKTWGIPVLLEAGYEDEVKHVERSDARLPVMKMI